ncbi:MAG: hypothetical protein ACTSUC_09880 [Promethearchaeota archaeon]
MADINAGIIRTPTSFDKSYIGDDGVRVKKFLTNKTKTARQKFEDELVKKEQEAIKKGLPFADQVARDDFKIKTRSQVEKQLREYGKIEHPEEIKVPEIDWDKYSDLKNFEVIEKGERVDDYLTKINPGLFVSVNYSKYKFKGYSKTYTIMEDKSSAIKRAQEKLAKSRK